MDKKIWLAIVAIAIFASAGWQMNRLSRTVAFQSRQIQELQGKISELIQGQ